MASRRGAHFSSTGCRTCANKDRLCQNREEFEALAGDFFARAAAPVTELLQRNPEAARNLSAVELLGGGTRVPRLQAALSSALGGRTLDK